MNEPHISTPELERSLAYERAAEVRDEAKRTAGPDYAEDTCRGES